MEGQSTLLTGPRTRPEKTSYNTHFADSLPLVAPPIFAGVQEIQAAINDLLDELG